MAGVVMTMIGSGGKGSNTLTLGSGSYTSGGKAQATYTGYNSDTSIVVSTFGTLNPNKTAENFPILAIYYVDFGQTITFVTTGNSTSTYTTIKVGATTYNFTSTGSYNSSTNKTTYTTGTIASTPFSGTVTVVLGTGTGA